MRWRRRKKLNTQINSIITGSGIALPDRIITNQDLEKMVDTNDQWITTRTGIKERRKLEEGKSLVDLAEKSAIDALKAASLEADELDLIIVATVTPDYPTPSTSCLLQARLKATRAGAFDLSAGCTGFVYAMTVAHQFISSGAAKHVLVVGAEAITRFTDWTDRGTCVLFGDGAGAVVLSALESKRGERRGILQCTLESDGRGADLLIIPGGGSALPASPTSLEQRAHYIKMNGNEIFKFAVRVVEDTLHKLRKLSGEQDLQFDWLILHQANLRIIEHIRKRLKMSKDQVPVNVDRYGNTSSATIPLALHEQIINGALKEGDVIGMVAFGAGLTWGGILYKY